MPEWTAPRSPALGRLTSPPGPSIPGRVQVQRLLQTPLCLFLSHLFLQACPDSLSTACCVFLEVLQSPPGESKGSGCYSGPRGAEPGCWHEVASGRQARVRPLNRPGPATGPVKTGLVDDRMGCPHCHQEESTALAGIRFGSGVEATAPGSCGDLGGRGPEVGRRPVAAVQAALSRRASAPGARQALCSLSRFSGTPVTGAQGLPGQTSREDTQEDRVTVWAAGSQRLTDCRTLSKSAAPQGGVKLFPMMTSHGDLTSRGKPAH